VSSKPFLIVLAAGVPSRYSGTTVPVCLILMYQSLRTTLPVLLI
jgi:hypothetical protein